MTTADSGAHDFQLMSRMDALTKLAGRGNLQSQPAGAWLNYIHAAGIKGVSIMVAQQYLLILNGQIQIGGESTMGG